MVVHNMIIGGGGNIDGEPSLMVLIVTLLVHSRTANRQSLLGLIQGFTSAILLDKTNKNSD